MVLVDLLGSGGKVSPAQDTSGAGVIVEPSAQRREKGFQQRQRHDQLRGDEKGDI